MSRNQTHEFRNGSDVQAHLIHQHQWVDYADWSVTDLLELHRQLHVIARMDEKARQREEANVPF